MIKEIWCMPHSHLDIGYTHPQPILMELQVDYLNQALELTEKTKDYPENAQFRWTVEANYVLKEWLKTADNSQIRRMQDAVAQGRICLTALPMHTTPCCDAREMTGMLRDIKELEEQFHTKIQIAINHDVNGQPWSMGQLLLDSGIDFYLTGINIHFGGLPFERPYFFQWEMADGRRLPSYLGEHYSMFSFFSETWEHSTDKMHKGLAEHAAFLEKKGYNKDVMFLTATNPPLYDNNCPDAELSDLIMKYNEEQHEWKIRIITAQTLREKYRKEMEQAPVHRGDWTDYWNFGCASTAKATRVSRRAKNTLHMSETLECFTGAGDAHYELVKKECFKNAMIYDEHTWGASQSISEPDSPEVCSQLIHKEKTAYQAADLAGYLLGSQIEALCSNPYQSNEAEGIVLVNTSQDEQEVEAAYPVQYRKKERQLSALRCKNYIPYLENREEMENGGIWTVPPFTAKVIPFAQLDEKKKECEGLRGQFQREGNILSTPFYRIDLSEEGRIIQLSEKENGKPLLDESRGWSLFEPVRETIDETMAPAVRSVLYGDNITDRHTDVSQWNHDWKPVHCIQKVKNWEIREQDYSISVITHGELPGLKQITQTITFYAYSSYIRVETSFYKEPVVIPESLYFAVPLKMQPDWKCSYDTAGEVVELDAGQLGNVCRDYLTVDTGVGIYDEEHCLTLACPDAPMIQVGDFHFGKENRSIARTENPLLLAWPLNNYWSTNFLANQSGSMAFTYECNFHKEFTGRILRKDGIHGKGSVVTGIAVHAEEEARRLISVSGSSTLLNLYPAMDKKGIILILKNTSEETDLFQVTGNVFDIVSACFVNPQEDEISSIEVNGKCAGIIMPPGGLRLVKLFTR